MAYVYFAQNLVNGKGYVGQVSMVGKPLAKRWRQHCLGHGGAPALFAAIAEFGAENFQVTEIESNLALQQARDMEKAWVARLKTNVPENGYNLTAGGLGGHRKGLRNSADSNRKNREAHIGRPLSQSHRAKIAAAWAKRKNNQ